MKLSDSGIRDTAAWRQKGYKLPQYDRAAVTSATKKAPAWLHFGAGNIFRGFPAMLDQKLLNTGAARTGIIVCEGYDTEIIDRAYLPFDGLSVVVTLKADGTIEKEVVGSVVESLAAARDAARLREIFAAPSLQMVSFTITEKGYSVKNAAGAFLPFIQADIDAGPDGAKSLMPMLVALLAARFEAGAAPVSMVSMDNCSHNGDKLKEGVLAVAAEWDRAGRLPKGFLTYLSDSKKVAFPWSMIDKITPRPDEQVRKQLEDDGIEDCGVIITQKNTYTALFVNAEESEYLVIEDLFPNGKPALDRAGIMFTDRETVDKVEKMKVCTCLNPLHTALAVFGCVLGYKTIYEEMRDPALKALVETIGYAEGLPVVVNPGILDPKAFIKEVVEIRFPNPFVPDTPQRIATDTSQKLGIRFGETIKAYLATGRDVKSLTRIPLVAAGWCRYLMGIGDDGKPFEISPDPLLDSVKPYVAGISLGQSGDFTAALRPILSDKAIFGVDLFEVGLAPLAVQYFTDMVKRPGAVRALLDSLK